MRNLSSRVDGLLSNGLHFAGISNGDWEPKQKLYDIVKKDSNYVCHGRRREQGSRGDLDRIRRIADEDGLRAVCLVGNLQQIRIAEKYLTYCEEPRNWVPNVYWLYGPSGAGRVNGLVKFAKRMSIARTMEPSGGMVMITMNM